MSYADLIRLYFDRSAALQGYWTLYVVVIGGLLAFSSLRQRRDAVTAMLVTVLFCFFACKNLGAIHDAGDQRSAALQAIQQYPAADLHDPHVKEILQPTLIAPDYPDIRTFHITCDVLTIAAIWAMERRRIISNQKV